MWVSISEKYEASIDGHIRNKKTKKVLKEFVGKDGYVRTQFDGKTRLVHRVIAFAFVASDVNKPFVNHKDGNIHNNNVYNLEWCTQGYNLKHAILIGLVENQCKICRKVIVKRDEKIITFDTMKDCAEFFGFKKGWLQNYVRKYGLNFSYKGYEIKINERG